MIKYTETNRILNLNKSPRKNERVEIQWNKERKY